MSILGQLVRTFGVLSLLSIGGANATIPEIHRQVVGGLHWMNDATFANLVAIGQTAPGPNVLVISMIGWHMAGVLGMLAATVAIVLPSAVLALVAGRLMTRYAALEWIGLARKALAPIAVGFMLASGAVMTLASYEGPPSLAIVAAVAGLVVLTRTSPFWGIMAGALAGVAGHGLHVFA
jgi:chromate transporter